MSDEVKKAASDAEEAATLQPLVDGIKSIADHVERTEKRTGDRVDALEKDVSRKFEDLEDKCEKGFSDMLDQQQRILKRTSFSNHKFEDITEPCRAALTNVDKAFIPEMEHVVRTSNLGEKSAMSDPSVALTALRWFQKSAKIQSSKFGASRNQDAADFERYDKALNDMVIKAGPLTEGTPVEGGNLVPTLVASEILRLIADAGDIFPRCRQVAMTKNTVKVPNESTAVTINWVAEEGTMSGGEPAFGQKNLNATKLAGRATMSIELVEDSNVAVLPYLLSVFSEKMAGELDAKIVLGDGTTPDITGIINASVNQITYSTAAGQALTWNLIVQTFVKAGEKAAWQNGVWVVSPSGFSAIHQLKDTANMPVLNYANAAGSPAMTLLGKEIIVSNRLAGTSGLDTGVTVGHTEILFGPLSAVLAGTRTSMRWDVTDQVNWQTFQMDCRLVGRFAGSVGVPTAWTELQKITY